jgi:hypothetical protein
MFHDNIQINIILYNIENKKKINNNNTNDKDKNKDNNNPKILRTSNSCKNLTVHKNHLKANNKNSSHKNKIIENKNKLSSITDYHINLIQKIIPLLQKLTKDKLILIYKSS